MGHVPRYWNCGFEPPTGRGKRGMELSHFLGKCPEDSAALEREKKQNLCNALLDTNPKRVFGTRNLYLVKNV